MVDREAAGTALAPAVEAAVAAGVDLVQVRDRELGGAKLLAHAREIAAAARRGAQASNRSVRIVVNRRDDIALASDADGDHIGFDAMAIGDARRLLGPHACIGMSTHSVAEASAATDADHVHLAPIFAPLSKHSTRPALGLDAIAAAARSGVPVLAQGGITAGNAAEVCRAGAAGVAVTGAILLAENVSNATHALRVALNQA